LDAIHLANQHSEQLNAQKIQQQNADTVLKRLAASSRLGVEIRFIQAQTTEAQNCARQQALDLANQQRVTTISLAIQPALRTELYRHDFSTFADEPPSVA
jgi:hypothetical protein